MRLLISACLLGVPCRYDGTGKLHPLAEELSRRHQLVPVCPEQMGGLPTPRPPAERRRDRVVTASGEDVTDAFRRGAEAVLDLCRRLNCQGAVLKERSPSCGSGEIYNGYFSDRLTRGDGIAAQMLKAHGIEIWGESAIKCLLEDG